MEFQRVMLLYTLPLYWTPRPVFHADRLREFLRYLLDPHHGGQAWLGIRRAGSSRSLDWYTGDDALRWVDTTYQQVWWPWSKGITSHGRDFAERTFDEFVEHKAEIFIDALRFRACLSKLPPEALAEASKGEEVRQAISLLFDSMDIGSANFYIGFSVDWSFTGGSLLWTPQLRISNFWPVSRRLAPLPPDGIPQPVLMPASDAARLLEDVFWNGIKTLFGIIRLHFELGSAYVGLDDRKWGAPIFYYAEPVEMPDHPEGLLEVAAEDLEILARKTMGVEDLQSEGISAGLLAGNLLTFRYELIGEKTAMPCYLLIPWGRGPRDGWGEEVEREAAFTADKLSFLEFSAGFEAYDILTDLAIPEESMALWGGSLDDTAELLTALEDQIASSPRLGQKRRTAFRMVHHLWASLARLEARVLRGTDQVLHTKRKWEGAVESTEIFAKRAFSPRPLGGLRGLLEGLRESFPYRLSGTKARLAAERAKSIQTSLDNLKRRLRELLEEEGREERERAERHQRVLGYALAALAAVTAFPLLIGQMDWSELRETMGHWPGFLAGLALFLQTVQPYITLISMMGAVLVISILLIVILRALLPPQDDPEERDLKRMEKKLIEAREIIREGLPMIRSLREQAFISHRIPGTPEPPEVQQMRHQVEAWDQAVCSHLIPVWEWAEQRKEERAGDRLAVLHHRIHRFILLLDLLNNRLTPLPLPRALALYRYKSTDFVRSSVVSDFEFSQVLNGYGFNDDEVQAIDAWVDRPLSEIPALRERYPDPARQGKRLRDLPARDFVEALREIGVSALHEREIQPPEVEIEKLFEALKEYLGMRDLGGGSFARPELGEEE
jgi:competence protein ComGC